MTTNHKKNLWLLGAALSTLLVSCGKKDSRISAPVPLSACEQSYQDVSHALVRSDLVHLCSTEHEGYQAYDQDSSGLFSQVFGGSSFTDVRNYLDTRLRYYLDPEDRTASVTLEEKIGNLTPNVDQNKKGRVSASNIGTALWYKSQILEKPLYFHFRGRTIPIESTRIGIMMMGDAYESTIRTSRGETQLPPEYRQSILIHEARHSDCTGGLSKKVLKEIREEEESGFGFTNSYRPTFNSFARPAESTNGSPVSPTTDESPMDPADIPAVDPADPAPRPTSKLSGLSCGHLHATCPPGHLLEGMAACDSEPWGAYTIGAIFYRGVIRDPSISSLNYNLAVGMIADVESRVLVPRTGSPDMTSKGLVE